MVAARAGVLLRAILVALYAASLIPFGVTFLRKVESFGRADILVSEESSGYRVRFVGVSAAPTGLQVEDVILLVDGEDALGVRDPSARLAKSPANLTILRSGALRSTRSAPAPAPWDVRYLFLFAVGAAFFTAGASALRQPRGPVSPDAPLLFAGFALAVALVLALTPVGPVDGFFRASVLIEDAARALFPALLLQLVFTFPRRARHVPTSLFFLPAAVLLVATGRLYFVAGGADFEASRGVAALDHAQGGWMTAAALIAAARLVVLSRRTIDLLTEKQVRFLLFGTAVGILPVCVLNLLPRLLGGSIPVLSSLSLLPLALVPIAFFAALTRYRLWDVEVLGRETAALIGAVLIGAGFFTIAQMLLAHPLSVGIPYAKALLQTSAGLLLALSFVPVRRGLSAALSRLQYRDLWREREGLLALVRELPAPRSLGAIRELLVTRISRGLGVSPAALLTVSGEVVDAEAVDGGEPLRLDELPEGSRSTTTRLSRHGFAVRPTPAVARLRGAGFRTLAPLAVSGRLLALFAVGDRAGRIPLSVEDQELLETVLAPAALALDHARLYEELKTQADRYRSLKEFHEDVVEGSAAAIASTDEEGRFTSVNPAFAALTGKPEIALLAARDVEILPAGILAGGAPRVEVDLGTGPRVLNVAVSPFPGAASGSRARVYVLYDATETARLEKALADRERLAALGTLSAGVAHEVNTPLAGVAGFARLLLDETPESSPQRRLVEKIEKQAFRASRLVGSLLDLARGRPREMVPLDPRDLAREARRALEDEAAARGVILRLDLPAEAPHLLGHGDALVQVLVNLVKNGIEAAASVRHDAPSAALVALRLHSEDQQIRFEVEDNGPGLTPEERTRVFQPFYSTKTAQGGTGLGLSIAGDIIREHGGQMTVDSVPGSGSRFSVTLPAAA